MTDPILPKIDLYCTTGGAHKEYHLFTTANPEGDYTLYYSNGRVGDALKPKVKTGPATLEAVTKVYNKTVKEKLGASPPYTEALSGVAYAVSTDAGELSGWLPQLLSEVDIDALAPFLVDDQWVVQEKKNGQRRAVLVRDGEVRGANKKGRYIGGLPQPWVDALQRLPDDTVLDAEHVGDRLWVFDAVRIGGEDLKARPFREREALVAQHLAALGEPGIVALPSVAGEADKRALLARAAAASGAQMVEGLVLRRASAPYREGRAASARHADCIKVKFYETAHALVLRKNAGRSVALGLLDADGAVVEVGSVTIPANQPVPDDGAVLSVRFMHMFEGGSLYGPPVSLGVAADATRAACTLAQVRRILAKAGAVAMDTDDDAA